MNIFKQFDDILGSSLSDNTNIVKKFEDQLHIYEEKSRKNPNNLMYQEEVYNYQILVETANNMNYNEDTYSGVEAAIILTMLRSNAVVQIDSNLHSGEYKHKYWQRPGFYPGYIWVNEETKHSFDDNISATLSQLGLISGGKINNSNNATVKIIQK